MNVYMLASTQHIRAKGAPHCSMGLAKLPLGRPWTGERLNCCCVKPATLLRAMRANKMLMRPKEHRMMSRRRKVTMFLFKTLVPMRNKQQMETTCHCKPFARVRMKSSRHGELANTENAATTSMTDVV